jgi:hypothetical protein
MTAVTFSFITTQTHYFQTANSSTPATRSTKMTRRRKPVAAIAEAKIFAERMGCRRVATPLFGQDPLINGGGGWTCPFPCSILRRRVFGTDLMTEGSSGNGANPLHDFLFKPLFLETGRFNKEKTVQFSRVLLGVKN